MIPMLAKTLGPKFSSYPCYVQPKLNGVRALYQRGQDTFWTFQSRDEKTWKTEVLAHIGNELCSLELGSVILDGELYVHAGAFNVSTVPSRSTERNPPPTLLMWSSTSLTLLTPTVASLLVGLISTTRFKKPTFHISKSSPRQWSSPVKPSTTTSTSTPLSATKASCYVQTGHMNLVSTWQDMEGT